eukprot:4712144-Amphidinium_carterae.1
MAQLSQCGFKAPNCYCALRFPRKRKPKLSNHLVCQVAAIFCVSNVTGEGLEYLKSFIHRTGNELCPSF